LIANGKAQVVTSNERVQTVVIGAGQAGLSASYHLTTRKLEHVVLERGRVAETWRSQRWDGFYLNTPNWAQRLPGFHYQGPEPDSFSPLGEVIAYLEAYATRYAAPIRENQEVTRVRREGRSFLVETGDSSIAADNVIVAAGAYQRPTESKLRDAFPSSVLQLHSNEYRRPSQLPEGAVMVVGSGQSGCQIAEELLGAGRAVYLSVGRCPWVPRRYRGRDLVWWMFEMGVMDQTSDALPSPEARLLCNHALSGTEGGHTCNPRTLAGRGARLMGRVEGIEGTQLRIGSGLAENLAAGDAFAGDLRRRVDDFVRARNLNVPDPEPEQDHPPSAPVTELDLREARVGSVIWASGFRPDHSWIEGVDVDPQGWPVQRRGVTSIPGLYFVGLHWLHKRKSSLFLGVGEDAEFVVSHLAKVIHDDATGGAVPVETS
jgi:putative flavoprotein involved in K+ transport